MKNLSTLLTVALILSFGLVTPLRAQTDADKARKHTEKIKNKVMKAGTGEKARLEVRLFDGTSYRGYVSESGDRDFKLVRGNGSLQTIEYSSVKEAVVTKSSGAPALGILLGAVAAGGIAVLWYFSKINSN